ncbi:hypothetical protein [Marivirga sp.]|uniref:hypothetical protein n=1 Tax=Marivirga sp. TaxID=2018662 RepID=UPI003DA74931
MTKETKNFDPEKKKAQVRFYCSAELRASVYDYIAFKLRTTGKEMPFSNALIDLVEMGLQMHTLNLASDLVINADWGKADKAENEDVKDTDVSNRKTAYKSKFQQRLEEAQAAAEKDKQARTKEKTQSYESKKLEEIRDAEKEHIENQSSHNK